MAVTNEMRQFQDTWEHIGKTLGFNDVTAKVFATIYAEPQELSLEELAIKTKYSLATISNTIKFIERFPMIKRIKKPGSKKLYVAAERDRLAMMEIQIKAHRDAEIKPMMEQLPKLISSMRTKLQKAKGTVQKERIKEQIAILENNYTETKVMDRINKLLLKELTTERKKLHK